MTEMELTAPYAGLAPGLRFAVIRRHWHAPYITVSPVEEPIRAYCIPEALLAEVG